jgi:ABC-type Co2+ transport system permease subunit
MGWFTVGLAVAAALMFAGSFIPREAEGAPRVIRGLGTLGGMFFLLGAIAAPWVGILLISRRPKR